MDITRRDFTKIGCKVIIGAAAGTTIIESMISKSVAAAKFSCRREGMIGRNTSGVMLLTHANVSDAADVPMHVNSKTKYLLMKKFTGHGSKDTV